MSKIEVKKAAAPQYITAWSYSRLTGYEECPQKTKFKVIDKLPEPDESKSPALVHGIEVHTAIELFLKGESDDTSQFKLLAAELAELKEQGISAELEITFNDKWELTGWFDQNAWLRIKVDGYLSANGEARIFDWKTGKNRGGYEDQLELYALAAMLIDETCESAVAELYFVDSGEIIGTSHGAYTRKDVEALKKKWLKRVKPMLSDTIFSPRPGNYCRWCNFSKSKGGPCRY